MYCDKNYRTKKALKEAVAAGVRVTVYQANADVFGAAGDAPRDGTVYLEGPKFPEPHRWYATATLKDGVVVKVS